MNKLKIELLSENIFDPIDLFLGCISYEKRCLSVPFALAKINIKHTIYFMVKEFEGVSYDNKQKLETLIKENLKFIPFSIKKPIDLADSFICNFNNVLDSEKRTLKIAIDITTFTRESLIMLVGMLYEHRQNIMCLYLTYSPASKMSEDWLSRGFRNLRSVLGFPGLRSSLKPLHIVVMTGFELERAKFIIDEYEPELISIGIGDRNESINHEFYKRNEDFVNELVNYYESRVQRFSFSLINPGKVISDLDSHISKYPEYNTILVPLNNKISTVGAALYCIKNEHIQICYLPAEEYNTENYSEPDEFVYLEKLDFNELVCQ